MIALVAAQSDGLHREVVIALDEADRAVLGTHDNGVGDGMVADHLEPRKKGTVRDACGTEKDAVAAGEVLGVVNFFKFPSMTLLDERGALFVVAGPHLDDDVAAKTTEGSGSKDGFSGATDTAIEIDAAVNQCRGNGAGNIAVTDHADGGTRGTDTFDEGIVAWAVKKSGRGSVWPVDGLAVVALSRTGRVSKVEVHGSRSLTMSGADFRQLIGFDRLRSLAFTIRPEGDDFVLDGRGWGHGVGMCQWGAAELARRGLSASEILAFYYPGARITRVGELEMQPRVGEGGS